MDAQLTYTFLNNYPSINISGSKSESNRLLILQQLFSNLGVKNLSNSDDTQYLQRALSTDQALINVGHAGTTMRFLTAFFACQENKNVILQGSERMHNRPIKILVDALKSLGASISYQEKKGYPPLKIKGKNLLKNRVQINGNVSSQYISALLLIAPSLPNGLYIELIGKITSIPYINMTLSLLNQLGIKTSFKENIIQVEMKKKIKNQTIFIESDWSSASYFYSFIALSKINSKVTLSVYKKESLQGDSCLMNIYNHFGVETIFTKNAIELVKKRIANKTPLNLCLKNSPDIAQTLAVTCFGLGIECKLSGLHTLKIKETDRLEALHTELTKLGAKITVTNEKLHLKKTDAINENIAIKTYHDHRMAMAFAPLVLKTPITILNAEEVTKSYQSFWKDLEQVGIIINR